MNYYPADQSLEAMYIVMLEDGNATDVVEFELDDSERDVILNALRDAGLDEFIAELEVESQMMVVM